MLFASFVATPKVPAMRSSWQRINEFASDTSRIGRSKRNMRRQTFRGRPLSGRETSFPIELPLSPVSLSVGRKPNDENNRVDLAVIDSVKGREPTATCNMLSNLLR